MLTHPQILFWGAYNFEKMPKTGFRNVADVNLKSCKNQTMVIETSNMAENDW